MWLHLDRRITWHKHIFAKRKQLGFIPTKLYLLLGHKSKLFASNKLLMYKAVPRPIWTYGIQLWDTASTSSIEILERFQSKALRIIIDALWLVTNMVITNSWRRNPPLQLSLQCSPQCTHKWPSSEPQDATQQQQAIAKIPVKWTAYQIPRVIFIFVV
jgi:hypothetical protein